MREQIKTLEYQSKRPFIVNLACVRRLQVRGAPKQRRLSRAGRPDDSQHLPLFYRKGNVFEHFHPVKALFYIFHL